MAEEAAWTYIKGRNLPVAVYSEDHGLRRYGDRPEHLLVVDPIDGTRSAAAGLGDGHDLGGGGRLTERPCIGDVEFALPTELKTGAFLYGERGRDGLVAGGYSHRVPALSSTSELSRMFWSTEFNGHPSALMTRAYRHLIDASANTGGVFAFSSASYSISRLITGQLDAYLDIGNRLLCDDPSLRSEFERVGNGYVLHLLPYDIAASVFLAEKAGVIITDAYGNALADTV